MSKIVEAVIWDLDLLDRFPGANMSILELKTEDGYVGLGEIAMAYGIGAKACQVLLGEVVKKCVIGRNVFDSQSIWTDIEQKSYWAEGRNLMHRGAQAAIDIALWDIKGQILNLPVYQLLGGKVRDKIPLYANHWYGEVHIPEDYAKKAEKVVRDGYWGLKFDPFRMSPDGVFSIPPRPLPRHWGELAVERVRAVREAVGPDTQILLDLHATLTTTDAIYWAKRLEEFDIFFYEEPVPSYNPEESLEVKNSINFMLAGGERLYTKQDFWPFIKERVFDLIQPDICLAGGFTGMKEIATLAATRDIMIQPHNCAGPVSSAASIHFGFSTPNLLVQEWFPYWEDNRYEYVIGAYEPKTKDGVYFPPSESGLGLKLDYEKMARFNKIIIS